MPSPLPSTLGAVMFDLDNTLAESKQPITPEMAGALAKLLERTNVAVISGGNVEQLKLQVAAKLDPSARLEKLYLLPTSGAALFVFSYGMWVPVYEKLLSADQVSRVEAALQEGGAVTGLIDFSTEKYGPYIENRGSQVSLSALGQQAPLAEKQAWDPERTKREALRAAIAPLLPDFDVKIGGLTTIDITLKGINKAYGVRALAEHLHIHISEMLYIGDELSVDGNDAVVKETQIPSLPVKNPQETLRLIEGLLG